MRDSMRVILFSVGLGIICSALLMGASLFTESYRKDNEKAEEIRNFLFVLEVPVDADSDTKALIDVFDSSVNMKTAGDLTLYEYVREGSKIPVSVAVSFSGMGLWGPVKGVLALEPDLVTIKGISFYQQEETPGLGGEIGSVWFQEQFKGKMIISETGEPGFTVTKPDGSKDRNSVDSISGATMTSSRIQTMLDSLARQIDKERKNYVQ